MSYRSSTTWICDQCGKEYENASDIVGGPVAWIDVSTGSPWGRDHPTEELNFCSWGCCARYSFKRSEGV